MGKQVWKPGNMLYPVPAVMVSTADSKGNDDIVTIAWAGTVCSDPVMVSISVRKSRYSHPMIMETGEFVINLVTEELTPACDTCGVKSGRDVDKWAECGLTRGKASAVNVPIIMESPLSLECRVKQVLELGSHDMFIAEVVAVDVDEKYMDETGKFDLAASKLMAYVHGEYYGLGEKLGKFGYTVKKK